MYDEFDLENDIQEMRENFSAHQMSRCCNCGSEDVSATAGRDAYCGECWRERERQKNRKPFLAKSGISL